MPEIFYEPPRRRRTLLWPATITLLVVNVGVYLLQLKVLNHDFVNARLALSVDGLRQGFVWQLLTFQFLHSTPWPWHLLFNCWALFMFGREVEWVLRTPRFLIMYFTGGVVGGLFQVFVMLMWPQYFGTGAVVGASAGIFGVVAAFAMLFPQRQLILLLYVVPIKMKARSMLWLSLIITAAGIGLPHTWIAVILGGNVAHAAHLGGILTGLALSGGRNATARAAQISSYYSQPPPLPEDPRS
jgi:membrane associated rhomboid family serine protease